MYQKYNIFISEQQRYVGEYWILNKMFQRLAWCLVSVRLKDSIKMNEAFEEMINTVIMM